MWIVPRWQLRLHGESRQVLNHLKCHGGSNISMVVDYPEPGDNPRVYNSILS